MQLHKLQKNSGRKAARRVGRGGKRGKTSGKGHKGQKSRAGHKIRPAMRDIIKRIPKRRGYGKNRSRTVVSTRVKPVAVNLSVLEASFESGDRVSPKELVAKGVVRARSGRAPAVKILGTGSISKKLHIANCACSAKAREAIIKAGGEIL